MDNYFDHIEDFISGRLSGEQKGLFESEMLVDEQLAFAVKEFKLVHDVQDALIEDDIQTSINSVRAELKQTPFNNNAGSRSKQRWIKPLAFAASLVFLVSLGYLAWQGLNGPMSDGELLALEAGPLHEKYFRAPVSKTVRGDVKTDSLVSGKADDVLVDAPDKPCDQAHQLMAAYKYREALDAFTYSLEDTDQKCKWKSEFYSALIYAIIGETEKCKSRLNFIIQNPEHGYHKKAVALLNDLE